MATTGIFTRRSLGLDNKVWASMFLLVLLSAGLVGYSYRIKGKKLPCESLVIYVNGLSKTDTIFFQAGERLRFRSLFSPNDKVVWDFGDNSAVEEGPSVTHIFPQDAIYTIRMKLNGYCEYEKKIAIKAPAAVELDANGKEMINIIGEERGFTGTRMFFSTPRVAEYYEWYIENNHGYALTTGDSTSYVFRNAGPYVLVLILDRNRQEKIRKNILISNPVGAGGSIQPTKYPDLPPIKPRQNDTSKANGNAPGTPPSSNNTAPARTYKYIANEIMKAFLQEVVCGKKSIEAFDDFLCDGKKTMVSENGKPPQDFQSFYNSIKDKKIEILSVIAGRDEGDCIVRLTVKLDKKGKLARHPCK